jgi:hypothetical protein
MNANDTCEWTRIKLNTRNDAEIITLIYAEDDISLNPRENNQRESASVDNANGRELEIQTDTNIFAIIRV